jgi:starch-binding outer membrane protein, SusD/RagB family
MKQRLFILLILLLFASSCDDMMKEDPVNKLPLHSPEDIEFALAGLYHQFAELNNGDLCMTLLNNRDEFAYASFRGDECSRSGPSQEPYEYMLLSAYKPLYKCIACANDIFEKTKNFNHEDTRIRHLLGEVYFMRAYCYFWLVRLFGEIPIIDNVDVNYSVPKATFPEIYNFIESDLQRAISLLPNSNHTARKKYVTPHRGSAKALLAEVYLNWAGYPIKDVSMYAQSASIAKEVIDSAAYFGLGLMPDLCDLWNGKHDLNQESVFSIYASYIKGFWGIRDREDELIVGNDIDPADIYFETGNKDVGIKFYNNFPNNYRKDITFLRRRVTFENWEYRINTIDGCTDMLFRKYYLQFDVPNTILARADYFEMRREGVKVIYMLRYSHTLLTYAEAKARSGSIDYLAYEAVNQIRRRANQVDQHSPSKYDISQELSTEQFADSVVWERAWEFCSEPESRWFDLVRLEMTANLKNLKDRNDGPTFSLPPNLKTYFFPIPKTDLMLNLELK